MDDESSADNGNYEEKVTAIFRELVGERADALCSGLATSGIVDVIANGLRHGSDMDAERARDIGFHLSDWHADAAFIVALHLHPERFTTAEIEEGLRSFLIHAPNHVAAAAALAGYPVADIFEVGALKGPDADD